MTILLIANRNRPTEFVNRCAHRPPPNRNRMVQLRQMVAISSCIHRQWRISDTAERNELVGKMWSARRLSFSASMHVNVNQSFGKFISPNTHSDFRVRINLFGSICPNDIYLLSFAIRFPFRSCLHLLIDAERMLLRWHGFVPQFHTVVLWSERSKR